MAGARRSEILNPDMNSQIETYPRDLLRRIGSRSLAEEGATVTVKEEEAVVDEVELSLGLSLGGSFGVDPTEKGLVRSSSVAAFSFFPKKEEVEGKESALDTHFLMRTCSLPVETGEEQRKRKEMQSLRRLEAKRKREEKRGLRPKPDENFGTADVERVEGLVFPRSATAGSFDSLLDRSDFPPFPSTLRGCGRPQDQQHNHHTRISPPIPGRLPTRQLSAAGVQGEGCSTSSSEYDCRPMQGLDISGLGRNSNPRAKSPPSIISPLKQTIQKAAALPLAPTTGKGTRNEGVTSMKASEEANVSRKMMARSMMEEMPCVSTKGDGPNGRRIEGLLCKYTRGEDVRIMCVCHGSFLSPAEFVKHAGGGDVEFPLRHIVVYPSQQTFS